MPSVQDRLPETGINVITVKDERIVLSNLRGGRFKLVYRARKGKSKFRRRI